MSPRFKSPLTRCLFTRSAALCASVSSSALRLATSLSATMPRKREDVLRGTTSSFFIFAAGFLDFGFAFAADLDVGASPA